MNAIEALDSLRHEAVMLHDRSELLASTVELQAAAVNGELVAMKEMKLHTENGPVWYQPGEPVPIADTEHRLLRTDLHLLTTAERWHNNHRFKELWATVRELDAPKKAVVVAADNVQRAQAAVSECESRLAELQAALTTAEKEHKAAEKELAKLVKQAQNN